MASRNLSYLGNPYQEGFGKAAILPTGQSSQQFVTEMGKIKEQQRAEATAKAAVKAAEKKNLDDFKVDYFIGHQGYFQDKVKDLQGRWVDLMANNGSLGDAKNPLSAQLQKDMYAIKNDAALSKQIEGFYDQVSKMTPEQKAKVSSKSLNELMDFYALPFDQQIEGWKNGTAPKLKPKVEIPNAEIDVILNNYIPKKDEIFGYTDQERSDEWEGRFMNADRELKTLITEEMFADEPDPKKAREDFIASKVGSVRALYDDRKTAAEMSRKDEEFEFKKKIGWANLNQKQKEFEYKKYKDFKEMQQNAQVDIDAYVDSIINEDAAAIGVLQDLLTTEVESIEAGKVVKEKVKPTVEIVEEAGESSTSYQGGMGQELVPSNEKVKYVKITYPNGKKPPVKIAITDAQGNVTEEGRQLLKGEITVPYLKATKDYGMPSGTVGYKAGQKIGGEKTVVQSSSGSGNSSTTPASTPAPAKKAPVFNMK